MPRFRSFVTTRAEGEKKARTFLRAAPMARPFDEDVRVRFVARRNVSIHIRARETLRGRARHFVRLTDLNVNHVDNTPGCVSATSSDDSHPRSMDLF